MDNSRLASRLCNAINKYVQNALENAFVNPEKITSKVKAAAATSNPVVKLVAAACTTRIPEITINIKHATDIPAPVAISISHASRVCQKCFLNKAVARLIETTAPAPSMTINRRARLSIMLILIQATTIAVTDKAPKVIANANVRDDIADLDKTARASIAAPVAAIRKTAIR